MARKVFVGGLSYNTTEEGLRQAFGRFGTLVEVKIITDPFTKKSRGFGFLTFSRDEDARDAKAQMDGAELDGRRIKVDDARDKKREAPNDYNRARGWSR